MSESPQRFPSPRRGRWQPLRSGLLNLYRFDNDEFVYENGHLLLRGNNGTGKSRILALQLPFLLDGEVAPHRLEPDGDPAKRIEWNLLMGKHSDRLGYSWIEFGKRGDVDGGDDSEQFLTLGCGLQAVAGRGRVNRWYFVTPLRLGVDFSLVGPAGEALSRQRLEEALGDAGEVFRTATDYRRAIDRHLFGLGEARYEALVNLLIQLRQPQLARKLDEELLSQALSDALAPLSDAILADVAEAFAGLESDRQALSDLRAATGGADAFLEVYRRYAQVLARRRAGEVRRRHSDYENSMKKLRAAEARRDDAAKRSAALAARQHQLMEEHGRLDAEVRALELSPEMRDRQALDAARRRAVAARSDRDRASSRLESAEKEREAGGRRLDRASRRAETRRTDARRGLDEARRVSALAGLDRRRAESWNVLDAALDPQPDAPSGGVTEVPGSMTETDRALEVLRGEADRRRDGILLLRDKAEEIGRLEEAVTLAREEAQRATDEVGDCVESHRAALEARDAASEALLVAFDSWRSGLQVLDVGAALARGALDGEAIDDETFAEALNEWGRELSGPEPLARLVQSAADRAREIVADHMATLATQIVEGRSERDELEAEARSLEDGGVEPPVPHTRDPQARSARSDLGGAPLWQLCDFRDDVSTDVRAAAEAALEASGLLDAWVTPDGSLLDSCEHDTVIVGRGAPAGVGERGTSTATLEAILRSDPAASGFGVAPAVVAGILRGIGWATNEEGSDPGRVWVSGDGRFRVGPLHGRWQKDAAQYVGASARRAERRRRLAEIARRLEVAEARLAELRREHGETQRQRDVIREEVAAAPTVEGVRDAASEVASKQREVARARHRQAEAESRAHGRRQSRDAAVAERDRAAEDLGLIDHLDDLEALRRTVQDYRERLGGLGPVLELHRSAAREMASRHVELEEQSDQCRRLRDELLEAERLSNRAEAERDTLEESLGASVEELLLKLDAARTQRAERLKGIEEGRREEMDLRVEEAKSAERIVAETDSLAGFEGQRQAAISSLSDVVALRLVAIAAPGVDAGAPADWSVTRAVDVARRLEAELAGVDAEREVWDRLQGRVHERFRRLEQTLLPHNYEPSLTTPSDTIVVKVPFQGQSKDVDEFRSALREETETRDRVLAAREREILENHLLSEVSLHLHDRLRDAEELVQEINAEIEDRPMSTGMKLRFDWSPRTADVEHLAEARKLLLTDHRMRSPDENRSIGRFLQNLIEAQRESNEDGTWAEHLSRALDYRAWHRFAIEQSQGGLWRRLTRRTHGTGSGGEKAIALTVPQFAAAAAHYRSARLDAPRLILLDEAFVGVDADMRAKCMGLLEAFDLDFVMTSEREWGCYPTLSGLAIYQLATHPGLDAVGLTRWVWNGKERVREEASGPRLAPAAPVGALSSKQTEIFEAGS